MLKQYLQFKLSQKLSPQQIQLMKLIQLPTDEFDDTFDNTKDEFDDNETINAEDINVDDYLSDDEVPDYRTQTSNYSADDDEKSIPYASGTSFNQHLKTQLNTFRLSDEERLIAEFLVGSVDESGYIRRSLTDIMDDLAFTQNVYTTEEKIEAVLMVVHQLDPAGVGARGLQECLLIQLNRKEQHPDVELAVNIIDKAFDHFTKKHYKKLLQKFDITEMQLKDAIEEIERLNPKPGGSYAGNSRMVEHVVPDFAIKIVDGELELTLNGRNAPELHVSREYNNMLKGYKEAKDKSKSQKDAVLFIKQKLDAAKWFIEAIKQRQQTLFVTMSSIMHYQKEYFLTGDERKLRPMILKDIADEIEMDVSLKEKGYPIARRTVAKYREQLDLPVARLRKKI